MTIRVDRDGYRQFLNAVGIGVTGGGIPVYDDGGRPVPWEEKPWGSGRDRMVSDTLRLMAIPSEELAAIRPPVPQYLFPPEIDWDRTPLTIEGVLDTDRWAPKQRSWVSPTLQPTTRAQYEDSTWSGSARNVSVGGSPFG